MAEGRIKEIGVRKVLGASVTNIVSLLSKDFVGLVAISFILASPVAWWLMHNWLQNYPYRVTIEWWIFVFAAGISIFIALATVSYHAIRAATANPVKSLRTE
jgi:ABC-type antimicrobial peptide transport system permease subunit